MDITGTDTVQVEIGDGVTEIRFDRPDSLNAANDDLVAGFNAALARLTEEPEGGLLITGSGRATQAGLDREVAEAGYPEEFPEMEAKIEENYEYLEGYPLPTAMACKGAVVGLGFGISLRCDFVVLGEETQLSMPEVEYDIPPISFPALQALVGPRVAKEIALTGERVDPGRARDLGLANRLVPEDEVEAAARDLLAGVVAHDPDIVADVLEASDAMRRGGEPERL